jgi:hypothetical protein
LRRVSEAQSVVVDSAATFEQHEATVAGQRKVNLLVAGLCLIITEENVDKKLTRIKLILGLIPRLFPKRLFPQGFFQMTFPQMTLLGLA